MVRLVVYACSERDQTPMTVKEAMTLQSSKKIYKKYEKATSRWLEEIVKNTIEVVTNENKAYCVKDINAGKLFLETVNSTNSRENSRRIHAFLAAGSERWLKLCNYFGGLKSAVQVASIGQAAAQSAVSKVAVSKVAVSKVAVSKVAVSKERLIVEHRQNTIANLKKNVEIADASAKACYELIQIAEEKQRKARENLKATEQPLEQIQIDKELDACLWPNFYMDLRKKWEATLLYEREVLNDEYALMKIRGEISLSVRKIHDFFEKVFVYDPPGFGLLLPFAGKGYAYNYYGHYEVEILSSEERERIRSLPVESLVPPLIEIVKLYEDSAQNGNSEAMYELARFYELQYFAKKRNGIDVIPFPAEGEVMNDRAVYWCKRAIHCGNIDAMQLMAKWLTSESHTCNSNLHFLETDWFSGDLKSEKRKCLQAWMDKALQPGASADWAVDNERFSEPLKPWREKTTKGKLEARDMLSEYEEQKRQIIRDRKERIKEKKEQKLRDVKKIAARNWLHDSMEYARALQALEAQAAALSATTTSEEQIQEETLLLTTTPEQPTTPEIVTTNTEEPIQETSTTESSTVTLEGTITEPMAAESEVMPLAVRKKPCKRKCEFKEEMLAKFSELQAENHQLKREVKNVQDMLQNLQGIVAQLQAEKGKNV